MLVPAASIRAAALVASILSIERDLSVGFPADSRAFVGLESAVHGVGLLLLLLLVTNMQALGKL